MSNISPTELWKRTKILALATVVSLHFGYSHYKNSAFRIAYVLDLKVPASARHIVSYNLWWTPIFRKCRCFITKFELPPEDVAGFLAQFGPHRESLGHKPSPYSLEEEEKWWFDWPDDDQEYMQIHRLHVNTSEKNHWVERVIDVAANANHCIVVIVVKWDCGD